MPPTAVFDVLESVIKEDMELKNHICVQVPLWPVLVQSSKRSVKKSLVNYQTQI